MKKLHQKLYSVILEIRFDDGFLYLDKCGQIILDITRSNPTWVLTETSSDGVKFENFDNNYVFRLNIERINFTATKAYEKQIDAIANEINSLWNIVKANIGDPTIIRTGIRFKYLIPTVSDEQSESILSMSKLNLNIPSSIVDKGYSIKNRDISLILAKETFEYRVNTAIVTRYEGINPGALLKNDPRALSKNQNKARLHQLKMLTKYQIDPMYAAQLDIDCYTFSDLTSNIKNEILNQHKIVENTFSDILHMQGA